MKNAPNAPAPVLRGNFPLPRNFPQNSASASPDDFLATFAQGLSYKRLIRNS